MRGEVAGGADGDVKRWRRHTLGKPWRKLHGKLGGGYGVRVRAGGKQRGQTSRVSEMLGWRWRCRGGQMNPCGGCRF